MPTKHGDVALLNDPVAQKLLQSTIPARMAYVWRDGSPRVIPTWFHWNGKEIVVGTFPGAPKLKVLSDNPTVAITIDDDSWPYKILYVRGTARIEPVDGVVPEYVAAADRYLGAEAAKGWIEQVQGMFDNTVRIVVTPEWVGVLDLETRFPSAFEKAMGA